MNRRHALKLLGGTALVAMMPLASRLGEALANTPLDITVHKTPWCGCCKKWGRHLRDNGFTVTEQEHEDLSPIKAQYGVPEALESCHTAVIGGYAQK